jgi:hypothetical protein
MKPEDVPEEWVTAVEDELQNWRWLPQKIALRAAIASIAPLIAAAEREACAKVAKQPFHADGREIAAAIRARGTND